MALRVLLADESSTIKKVMQLSLQDFGVEVKAVAVGLDVLQVAKSFKPDIIFADILLTKKNGYEICAEIKNDAELKRTPVVLMWSGFMEMDEQKLKLARPDYKLEKPFDAEALRNLVKRLVPSVKGNVISDFLTFPNIPEIIESQETEMPNSQSPTPTSATNTVTNNSDDAFDEPEEFSQVNLSAKKNQGLGSPSARSTQISPLSSPPAASENWSHQNLNQFKIEIPKEDSDYLDMNLKDDVMNPTIALSSGIEEIGLDEIDMPKSSASPLESHSQNQRPEKPITAYNMEQDKFEQIIRAQVREVIESIAWKIIPDITDRIVREELQKLLKDAEKL